MQAQETFNYPVVRQFALMTVVWGIVCMAVAERRYATSRCGPTG